MPAPKGAPSAWAACAFYMGVIWLVSAMPFRSPLFDEAQKFHLDWLVHVVEYSVLGFFLVRAVERSRPEAGTAAVFATAMVIGVLYAVTDEFHQRSVPTRDASAYDAVADTVGTFLGTLTWLRRHQRV